MQRLTKWAQQVQDSEEAARALQPGNPIAPLVPLFLPADKTAARLEVMQRCLLAGMNLTQIVSIAPLFKFGGVNLVSTLSGLIPALRKSHLDLVVKPRVKKVPYTICFDGTTRFCNVEALLVWVLDEASF